MGRQAEASRASGVRSALRNTRGRPVRTQVAVANTLTGDLANRAKSMDWVRISRSGLKLPGLRS